MSTALIKTGRSAVLIRITAEMRSAIDAEAATSGRSISQVCELWLEDGRFLHALKRKVLAS